MFQCIANCWRGWAQLSITIVKKAKSREARPFAHATATMPPPTRDRFLPQGRGRALPVLTSLICHNMLSLRHVRLRTNHTVTHCRLVTARVPKGTFFSPRPPISAQTTPHRYTTRHGTKTPGPEVGVKPNLAWQPERAVTTDTRADGPRPPRATQQPRKRFQQLAHTWQTTYRPIHDARGSPKWS